MDAVWCIIWVMEMVQGHATEPPRILGFDVSQGADGWQARWVGTLGCDIALGRQLSARDYPTLFRRATRFRTRAWAASTAPSRVEAENFLTGDHA